MSNFNAFGDSGFNAFVDSGFNARTLQNIILVIGGQFIIGEFTSFLVGWDGESFINLHWDTNGHNSTVTSLTQYNDRLAIGGAGVFLWNQSSYVSLDTAFGVTALQQYNNELWARGKFIGFPEDIMKWDGVTWSSENPGTIGSTIGSVKNLSILPSGLSYNSGDLIYSGSRWDGLSWNKTLDISIPVTIDIDSNFVDYRSFWFYKGTSVPYYVFPYLPVIGKDLYQGRVPVAGVGESIVFDSTETPAVVLWDGNSDKTLASANRVIPIARSSLRSFGLPDHDQVYSLLVYNGDLIVAGKIKDIGYVDATWFNHPLDFFGNQISINNIARYDGSNWYPLGSGVDGVNGTIYDMAVLGDLLIVGGDFTEAGGQPAENIAVWDGSTWSQLGSGIPDFGDASQTRIYALSAFIP